MPLMRSWRIVLWKALPIVSTSSMRSSETRLRSPLVSVSLSTTVTT